MRKPDISENLRYALEECGTETIRTILLHDGPIQRLSLK